MTASASPSFFRALLEAEAFSCPNPTLPAREVAAFCHVYRGIDSYSDACLVVTGAMTPRAVLCAETCQSCSHPIMGQDSPKPYLPAGLLGQTSGRCSGTSHAYTQAHIRVSLYMVRRSIPGPYHLLGVVRPRHWTREWEFLRRKGQRASIYGQIHKHAR